MLSFFKRHIKFPPLLIAATAIVAGIFLYYIGVPFFDLMEFRTVDLRFSYRGPIAPGGEVVLAVIDEKSLAREGKWVWPRSKLADLVTKISQAGARVIAFDVGFFEPDDKRILHTIDLIEAKMHHWEASDAPLERYLTDLRKASDYDRRLAEAVGSSKAKVILGYFFQMDPESAGHVDRQQALQHSANVRGSSYKIVKYSSPRAQQVPLIEAFVPQSNITEITAASAYAGYFNMYPDPDGVVRWMPGVIKFKDALYAPLSVMAVSAYTDQAPVIKVADYGVESLEIGRRKVPTDEAGRILINYRGRQKTFPHLSITDILRGEIDDDLLRDKIVMVGATAVGIYDLRVTPLDNVFPGLEVHANIVDSILARDYMYHPAWGAVFDAMAIIVAALLLAIVVPRTRILTGALATLALFFGYILLCNYLFAHKGWILNLVYPLSVIIFVYLGITVYRYFAETRQKLFIKDAFATYLAPTVVKQLIEAPEKLVLGGEERVITAFFSDVQGFTGISERLAPAELVELLNEFLTEMTNIILKHEGTVDKFEGDAIIAFFGAPNDLENQAEVACMACIDMQKRLREMRGAWRKDNRPELRMRIGVNTGPAVVGNMGSRNRMDYTMMGDTVNTAARLEGVNKVYGTYTMISDPTFREAGQWISARELDAITVVGKAEPVKVYELLGYPGDVDDPLRETVDLYEQGLAAYRRQDWNRAIMLFLKALAITPQDGPSQTMLSRCNEFKVNPPPPDWNGSYSMKTK